MSLRDPNGRPYTVEEATAAAMHIGAGAYSLDNPGAGAVVLVNVGVAHQLQRLGDDDVVVNRQQLALLLGGAVFCDAEHASKANWKAAWALLYAALSASRERVVA